MEEGFLVEFNHFGFKYNAQAEPTLYDISLKIRKGEKILIAGPSGCGKSTIGSCLNGLIPFSFKGETTGSLRIKGKETRDMSIFELSKIVGTVLQDSDAQFVGMTAAEDIAFALENDCIEAPELHERTEKVAKTVGVSERLTHAPGELSGGQKQRVSIGGIMVDNVELYLFDEPLANLDPATGKQAIELIDEIKKETGAAVVIIEHRLEDVLWRDVDRIILMQEGRIIADLDPDTLLSTDLLRQAGVREPLYVTALKYAGVGIRPEIKPHSINSLALAPEETEKVREWFEHTPEAEQKKAEGPILSVKGLEFEYPNGVKAADNISTDIRKGTLIAIAGRNGAGKSTFAKLICGFETHQNGTIILFGKAGESDLAKLSIKERADHIGYVMQNPNQMISQTMIFDEVAMGLRSRKIGEDEIQSKVEKALKICGLYPFRNWPVSALSFGQKKRVTIASILVLDPEVLILDEPTAGQDFRHYTEIMEFLKQLNADGLTIIMITHDMHLMLEYATRSIVFCDGKIVGDDTGANILTDPEIVEKASLKETSLFRLALMCGIETPRAFVQRFIDFDRAVRS
ncbi:MAG: ABC transporter ATP-binding protein [Oscillospiraceae bacterium]|nr:ABC transporter ATP-binding protein [Oscillospiraceae bacterium]